MDKPDGKPEAQDPTAQDPTAQDPTAQEPADVKIRRKSLGWSRAELAHRAGIDPRVVQLIELSQWTESGALTRVGQVLARAESGETDVHLRKVQPEAGASRFSNAQDDDVPRMTGGKIPEA
ncbi:MAG: helix-turn-helix transcriptional regulator [Oligoflexia bacterium]|nr:helix-turn-helix transcriptional regulator [Oligoflexia bacterium]